MQDNVALCPVQPSHWRAFSSLASVLRTGAPPCFSPLQLLRLSLSCVPTFSRKKGGVRLLVEVWDTSACFPTLIFANGSMQHISALPVFVADRCQEISLDLSRAAALVSADFSVKCSHVKLSGKSQTIFRAALHAHFVDPSSLQLAIPLAHLDDVGKPRFYGHSPDQFSVSLAFSHASLMHISEFVPHLELDDPAQALIAECPYVIADELQEAPRPLSLLYRDVQINDGLPLFGPAPSPMASSGYLIDERALGDDWGAQREHAHTPRPNPMLLSAAAEGSPRGPGSPRVAALHRSATTEPIGTTPDLGLEKDAKQSDRKKISEVGLFGSGSMSDCRTETLLEGSEVQARERSQTGDAVAYSEPPAFLLNLCKLSTSHNARRSSSTNAVKARRDSSVESTSTLSSS